VDNVHAVLRTVIIRWSAAWFNPQDEARSRAWLRQFYRDAFSDTGGVPVRGEVSDGAFINHPDVDLADPERNTSGVPWHTLYYKDNYRRLQPIKARWNPRNVFHHALSIRPETIVPSLRRESGLSLSASHLQPTVVPRAYTLQYVVLMVALADAVRLARIDDERDRHVVRAACGGRVR
jgi:hypothetical protein